MIAAALIVMRVPDWMLWLVSVAFMVSAVTNGIQAYLNWKLARLQRKARKEAI